MSMNNFVELNKRIIGCVICIKKVRMIILNSFFKREEEKVVFKVFEVCFFLVNVKLFRIVVWLELELGIFMSIEVKVVEVGMMVIKLIKVVRVEILFMLYRKGRSKDKLVILFKLGNMLMINFKRIFSSRYMKCLGVNKVWRVCSMRFSIFIFFLLLWDLNYIFFLISFLCSVFLFDLYLW